ncbi:RbsD/FucU domain-containing protein [Devosia sp. XK-2]|uniref:RbsD/FucU family protein n=1 Tax=Devosia sp. XK-2 TaxID=3126689 RepID=UPI0030CFB2AA
MLKNIPALLGPELLSTLRAMGHGDELVIADANFPAEFLGPMTIRADGISATAMLDAILTLLPLDQYVEETAIGMQVVGDPTARQPIDDEFEAIIARHEPEKHYSKIERFAFYDRAAKAAAVIQTGETRLYGNIILKKGVIRPQA